MRFAYPTLSRWSRLGRWLSVPLATWLAANLLAGTLLIQAWQLWVIRDQEKRQLRAYVIAGITKPLTLAPEKPVTAYLLAQNVGQTPVKDLSVRATIFTGALESVYHSLPSDDRLPVIQARAFFGKDYDLKITSLENLKQTVIDQVGKSVFIVFVGVMTYKDVFDKVHHTQFCRYWPGTAAQFTSSCTVHNRLD